MVKRAATEDQSPEYWAEYTNLQRVKHDLIRRYLGGWFAKLGTWAGRILYIDTHAGRGKHLTGDLGSPLVALRTLLNHVFLPTLLKKSEFRFMFIERDEGNCAALRKEIAAIELPKRVHVAAFPGEAFANLEQLAADIATRGKKMAPAFIFVDPYGFKLPGTVLRQLLEAGRTELFINVIWRELDMAIAHARAGVDGHVKSLTEIFDGDRWKQIDSGDFDERANQAANAFAEMTGAAWSTYIRMLGDNGATRYLLLHLTNHPAGRDLMKDCMWSICPAGGFYAKKSTDAAQQFLIEPEPDLMPLKDWVMTQLLAGPRRWSELEEAVRPEIWRIAQLNDVVREFRRDNILAATDFEGRFTRKADPLLSIQEAEA